MAKTRQQLADQLSISTTTLWRKIKAADLEIESGLIYPSTEAKIMALFGEIPDEENNSIEEDDEED